MKQLLLVLFHSAFLPIVLATDKLDIETRAANNICFDEYEKSVNNTTSTLRNNVSHCDALTRQKRTQYDQDKQAEREEVEAASEELCARLQACNAHVEDYDFFKCYADEGLNHTYALLHIHLNATAALVDLEERYEAAEKERMHCLLEAQHVYLAESNAIFQEFMECSKR